MQSKWGLKTQNTKNTKGDVKINFTCLLAWAQKRLISYIQVCLWGCFPNTLIWTRRLDKDLSSPLLLGIGSQSTKDPRRIKKVKNKFVLCDCAGISIVFLPLDIRALGSWAFRLRHTPSAPQSSGFQTQTEAHPQLCQMLRWLACCSLRTTILKTRTSVSLLHCSVYSPILI